jgi:hypothetical protein
VFIYYFKNVYSLSINLKFHSFCVDIEELSSAITLLAQLTVSETQPTSNESIMNGGIFYYSVLILKSLPLH